MNKKIKITKKQKIVLEKIYAFIVEKGYSPTIRELAQMFGFSSPKGAADHIGALAQKGYLVKNSSPRSIRLTDKSSALLGLSLPNFDKNIYYLPLLGKIAAGLPIFADENIEEYVPVSSQIMGKAKGQFLLKVSGDSMTGDHIMNGDTLIVKSQNTAKDNDIVVALIGEEAVVKRFIRKKDGTVELRSSNPLYSPIIVKDDEDALKIQGKVIAIYRNIT
jgi:repressor LexA